MLNALRREWHVAIVWAVAGWALLPLQGQAQEDDPDASAEEGLAGCEGQIEEQDLDCFSDDQLGLFLVAELDDVLGTVGLDPAGEYAIEDLVGVFIAALGDEGDEEDPYEQVITSADLDQEMAEAGTRLEIEVAQAVMEADADVTAGLQRSRGFMRVVQVDSRSASQAPGSGSPARVFLVAGPRDGKPRADVALQYTASRVANTIKVASTVK